MDILGSIMKNMTKPPQLLGEEEKRQRQKQQEQLKRVKEEEQKRVQAFRESITKRVSEFIEDTAKVRLTFEPMNKPQRALVHDILDKLGFDLVVQSFGKEEVDRHMMIFKPDHVPCEAELLALRRGEEYNPEMAAAVADPALEQIDVEGDQAKRRKQPKGQPPEYLQKYEKHFGGLEVAKEAAKSTKTARSYGFVSSELKSDKRTIEQTLADIRARKKQKLSNESGGNEEC